MLEQILDYIHNYFDNNQPKWSGDFKIENGMLVLRDDMSLKDGQYFRIIGSVFNDGIYQYGNTQLAVDDSEGVPDTLSFALDENGHLIQTSEGATPRYHDQLTDEEFTGSVWAMAVPPAVIALSVEISNWVDKYGSAVNSPYQSESFGGYNYTKAQGGGANSASGAPYSWQNVFASRLNRWRKIS